MVVEYIRYRIPDEDQKTFLGAYRAAAKSLDNSDQCTGYELTQCAEQPERFILRILWTSMEAHLKEFRSSEEFRTFLPHVRPFIDYIEEMQHYRPTDIRSD